ncbi:MAG TPA: glycosyltransferase [Pyrinomonadaceae bacterium]|nr:glycosyltransferase [Pyrinomonadaceae bacterium]
MGKIVLATIGSLGDMHPKIALALELKKRGHSVTIAAMEFYRDRIEPLGLRFLPMAPHLHPDDKELARDLMDSRKGTEKILREIVLPNLRPMFDDLMHAIQGADLLVSGEIVYAAKSAVEITGVKWITTSLQPSTFFSSHDPSVPPNAPWVEHLRFLGPKFHHGFFRFARWLVSSWFEPYREFRRGLGLNENHDPIFFEKFSPLAHLALFSRALGAPQSDWPPNTVQTGFCFYDGHDDIQKTPPMLLDFLDSGEPPIVFTLGSAAVMDARDFFEQSADAARMLGRRAVLIYGVFSEPPTGIGGDVIGFDYAPYSQVFPRASCIVHQGGAGTTGQALRAGVPQLIVPFAHDQPDNAVRCRRAGVAEILSRDNYNAKNAAPILKRLISDQKYKHQAIETSRIVNSESGTIAACDAIEAVLRN